MSFRISRTSPRGFTLVEIAVVLGIVAILLTIGIAALTALATNQAITETRKKQDTIRDALIAYLGRNGRLPCPDIPVLNVPPDGRGDDNRLTANDVTTLCGAGGVAPIVASGVVPFAELGLAREIALDGWSNYMTYQVTNMIPPTNRSWTISFSPATPNGFQVGSPGNMIVTERTFPGGVSATANLITAAPVVLISHGLNGSGATTLQGTVNIPPPGGTDEANNLDGDGTVIRRQSTETVIPVFGAFDDIVTFYSVADLTTPLTQSGTLKSTTADLNQLLVDTRSYIFSYAGTNGCIPAHLPDVVPLPGDLSRPKGLPLSVNYALPWGSNVTYQRLYVGDLNAALAGANGYQITYILEDGITQRQTVILADEFRAIVLKNAIVFNPANPGPCFP
jgi:prepilin-type N-terminal cleavage/methylation domain-containing protein